MILRISMIILTLILVSCSKPKPEVKLDPYSNCLPETFRNDLTRLVKSFEGFIDNNYKGVKSDFLSVIVKRELVEEPIFMETDLLLIKKLRADHFSNYVITKKSSDQLLRNVDTGNVYLDCLNNVATSGSLIKEYVKLKSENFSLSRLAVGRLFLYSKTDPDYSKPLTDKIIAVELYYNILDAAFE